MCNSIGYIWVGYHYAMCRNSRSCQCNAVKLMVPYQRHAAGDGDDRYDELLVHLQTWTMDVYNYFYAALLQARQSISRSGYRHLPANTNSPLTLASLVYVRSPKPFFYHVAVSDCILYCFFTMFSESSACFLASHGPLWPLRKSKG